MRTHSFLLRRSVPLIVAAVVLVAPQLRAAGTAAGLTIGNQATITYAVAGEPQMPILSPTAAFVVDRKINLIVFTDELAAVAAPANSTANVLTFTVANTGNGTQDFSLATRALPFDQAARFAGSPNATASGIAAYVENGDTSGYQVGEDTATFIDELAPDTAIKVYLLGDFTGSYNNGEIASYHLLAQAREGGTSGGSVGAELTETIGGDTLGEDVVFADGRGSDEEGDFSHDAKFSDFADFAITTSAALTVTKTSMVYSDPINDREGPKAIPGAMVEYTITISNATGAPTATGIVVTDDLSVGIAAGTIAFNPHAYGPDHGVVIQTPNLFGNTPTNYSNEAGDDYAEFDAGSNTVIAHDITLAGGETAYVRFMVEIR